MKGKLFIALRLFSSRMDRTYIPIVNWISSLAIAIGLASILIVLSVMNGFEEEIYKKILKSEPHLILKGSSDTQSENIKCNDLNISGLIECESFSKISGIVESDSLIQAGDIRSYSSSESSDIASDGNTVMIQSSLAAALDVDDGDYLSISIPQVENNAVSLSKAGAYKVKQIETGDHSISNSSEIILDLESFNKLSNERGAEHNLILWLEDPFDVQSVSKEIEMILASYQYEIRDWMEINDSLFKAILIEKAVMTGLLFFVVLIAIFNIMVMISMTIENKKGDIAILKSLGYNQKDVTQIFLIQGFIANIVGIVFGLILSLLVLYNLVYIEEISRNVFNLDFFPPGLYILDSMPYVIKLSEFVWICIATILIGMMASYIPSRITSGYSVPDLMRLYRS